MTPIHKRLEKALEPVQPLVTFLLILVALVALYAAFFIKDRTARTAILVWAVFP